MSESYILTLLEKASNGLARLHEKQIAHNHISLGRIYIVKDEPVLGLPYFSTIESIQRLQTFNQSSFEANIYFPP